jgi:protease-4
VAASGGYWIATAADRVFAQPNTITGSIGVVILVPHFDELAGRFSVSVEHVKLSRHADIFSVMKARDDEAMAILQARVDDVYRTFLDHVVESRGLERPVVESLAGGRVWSGADALGHGLIDEIGGLDAAIADAAKRAGIETYAVVDLPAARSFVEELMEKLSGRESPMSGRGPARDLRRHIEALWRLSEEFGAGAGVHARMPFELELN